MDGSAVGKGGVLACDHVGGASAEVEARIERFVIEEGCADPIVVPWLDPFPEWFAPLKAAAAHRTATGRWRVSERSRCELRSLLGHVWVSV